MEKLNILIVEDNKIVVMGIKKIYNKHIPEAVISTAENGLEAIELVKEIEPDVLLIDIRMPEMNGIDAIKEINKSETKTSRDF